MSKQERTEGAYTLSTANIYQDLSMYQALGEIFYVIIQSLGQLKNQYYNYFCVMVKKLWQVKI